MKSKTGWVLLMEIIDSIKVRRYNHSTIRVICSQKSEEKNRKQTKIASLFFNKQTD